MDGLMSMASNIVASYVANNQVPVAGIPALLRSTYEELAAIHGAKPSPTGGPEKATKAEIKASIKDDRLICFEDGKSLTMLKRYLRCQYKMTPEQYRAKWGLPSDYPMTAPAYARYRSAFAKNIGLGKTGNPTGAKRVKKS